MKPEEKWLKWIMELQALAQAGEFYGRDKFDLERYSRIREISAEMLSAMTDLPLDMVKDVFCCEVGYQTPKLDTRAAIFQDDKILLVQESDGRWSMPGGWVDYDLSVKENTVKEVKEEAGLDVTADYIIAVQDREKHNQPRYIYKVCKVFVMCSLLGGSFARNIETLGSGWFSLEELPELAEPKVNAEQIAMCFDAYRSERWTPVFD